MASSISRAMVSGPLSLLDVAEELDDGVVRHTARPAVCVHLHHAVGALAQMRVLHILDALQLRHHLGRIHQRTAPLLWGGGLRERPAGFLLLGALLL